MSLRRVRLPGRSWARAGRPPGATAVAVAGLAMVGCASSPAATARPTVSAQPSAASPSAGAPTGAPHPTPGTPGSPTPPSSPQPARESPAPLGRPVCSARALTVVDADAVTTASSLEEVFVVRTNGPDCQLEGYPTLAFSGADGKPLAVRVDRGGHGLAAATPAPVTLSASTSVSFRVATARSGPCRATSAVQVTLPGTGGALTTSTAMSICDGSVGVSPVQRRAGVDGS